MQSERLSLRERLLERLYPEPVASVEKSTTKDQRRRFEPFPGSKYAPPTPAKAAAETDFKIDFDFKNPSLGFEHVEGILSSSSIGSRHENPAGEDILEWLRNQLQQINSFLSSDEMFQEILKICKGDGSNMEIALFDLIGEINIEFISEVIQRAEALRNVDPEYEKQNPRLGGGSTVVGKKASIPTDWEGLSANQKKKAMLREQKEMNEAIEASLNQSQDWLQKLGFSPEYIEQERALGLQKNQNRNETWRENLAPDGSRVYYEQRSLPEGTTRRQGNGFEEVFIPAAAKPPPPAEGELVAVDSLEPFARPAFLGTKYLNRIQSKVYPCAFFSSENMLVCAPTGAGKTNIAMLALLQLVRQHVQPDGSIDKSSFKAIYIAPMKALAQEVVAKFSERLAPLGMVVKEYTGDMQLTKAEIAEAQLLVCTPEKYDVSTRKGGDGSLGTLVSLIIIDEVHLLADERGAVIEMIVARTQRYVETSQRIVRIVGLSATLPNYQDVGNFLRVNPATGLFFFGSEFRPIPLDQTFIGVTEKNRMKRNDVYIKHAFEEMVKALRNGKQVMIFVHSRKDTSKTMTAILEMANNTGQTDLLENVNHEKYLLWKREVDKSRSQEVRNLFANGMGIHHAGMLRSDRSLSEQLFECGLVKVLCCTATLAWGVNLPAHTVIIKGTEMYDPERGGFVDLSILDVLQIFGRAGRPQYDSSGHAILITPHESLNNYLAKLSNQAPIESALIKSLADHMNAEIVNGTINNIKEAVAWLTYTFLFIRMKKNGLVYGIRHEEIYTDPQLEKKRFELVKTAAETLDNCMMARFDKRSGNLGVTDLGRIASHYYIKHTTIESFNRMLAPHLSDPDAIHVLCSSSEFDSLKVRPEELTEIDKLQKSTFMRVKVAADDVAGKVNVLLQSYLSRLRVDSFTLQSDTNYVAQNAGRICRALFEICLRKGWSSMSKYYLTLCKSIDRRVRLDHSPLRQFDDIPVEILQKLEKARAGHQHLLDMTAAEIGELIRNHKMGPKVKDLVSKLPMLAVSTQVKPITKGILRLSLSLTMAFDWVDRYHGYAEPFWIWVEDSENEFIYHSEYVVLQRKDRHEAKVLEITIPVRDPLPTQYFVRVLSDVWVGCETVTPVSFRHLLMPQMMSNVHTDLLNLHPMPVTALKNPAYESLYNRRFSHFNPIQTQMFHTLYHTDRNVLVGAPTGSGKTITAELAILRQHRQNPRAKTVYVAPLRALARERLQDWQERLAGPPLNLKIVELTGEFTPEIGALWQADILIVTPEKWDSISRGWQRRGYVQAVGLVIIDEIHLLGVERGPVLEVIVSRMRFISAQTGLPVRFVGLSTALANARDLGDWLGIDESHHNGLVGNGSSNGGSLYNFRPSVRPVPMRITIQGFPGKHYCPRMATMNKPAYAAILEHSPSKPVLIFVSSRRQTRLTALDLIALCAADDASTANYATSGSSLDSEFNAMMMHNSKRFLGSNISEEEITAIAATLQDAALRDTIVFGVGIHHAGLDNHDRSVVETLFLQQKIQVLVCTSTLAWGVNLPCHLVIVKGTEFYDGKTKQYVDMPVTDILQMLGRAGRPQFDDSAEAVVFVHEPKKHFYKKFLHDPFPVESSLHTCLHEHLNAEICATGTIRSVVPDCVDYLTWTYYYRRLLMNPAYYGLNVEEDEEEHEEAAPRPGQQHKPKEVTPAMVTQHMLKLLVSTLNDLLAADCVRFTAPSSTSTSTSELQLPNQITQTLEQLGLRSGLSHHHENHHENHNYNNNLLEATFLGKVASYYYLHYRTPINFRTHFRKLHAQLDSLSADQGQPEQQQWLLFKLCQLLCDAQEFSEVPVRHNEELLNAELAVTLGLCDEPQGQTHPGQRGQGQLGRYLGSLESSHTKALLLVLAHLQQAPLPIADYVNDTKSVLEQLPRVLNAMIDIAAEDDHYWIVKALMQLAQLIGTRTPFLATPQAHPHPQQGSKKDRSQPQRGGKKNAVAATTTTALMSFKPQDGRYRVVALRYRDSSSSAAAQSAAEATTVELASRNAANAPVVPLPRDCEVDLTVILAAAGERGERGNGRSGPNQRGGGRGSGRGGGGKKGDESSWWIVLSSASDTNADAHSDVKTQATGANGVEDASAANASPAVHVLAMKRINEPRLVSAPATSASPAGERGEARAEVTVTIATPDVIGRYLLTIDLIGDAQAAEFDTCLCVSVEIY